MEDVLRVDLHIVKPSRRWHLQDARGRSLGDYKNIEDALVAGAEHARAHVRLGLQVRLLVHRLGSPAEIIVLDPKSE